MSYKKALTLFYFMLCNQLVNLETASEPATPEIVKNVTKYELYTLQSQNCANKPPSACESMSFDSKDYVMFPNGSVFVQARNLKLNECAYTIENEKLVVCKSVIQEKIDTFTMPCGATLSLSIAVCSVFLPLFFAMLAEDVRELIHVNWRGLILAVFFFHFLLQTVNLDEISESPEFRYTFPSLIHFFTLVVLSWMTIMSHDGMMLSESAAGPNPNYMELMKNFRGHLFTIFTSLLVLITVSLLTEVFAIVPSHYKPDSADFCWVTQRSLLLFCTGPVLAFSIINFLNFIGTYFYFTQKGNAVDESLLVLRQNYLVHFKLFVIMDITWLVGVLVFLSESEWLWRIFVGIFILEEACIIVVPFNSRLENWVLTKLSGE